MRVRHQNRGDKTVHIKYRLHNYLTIYVLATNTLHRGSSGWYIGTTKIKSNGCWKWWNATEFVFFYRTCPHLLQSKSLIWLLILLLGSFYFKVINANPNCSATTISHEFCPYQPCALYVCRATTCHVVNVECCIIK